MWGATSLSIVPPGVAAARWSGFRYIKEEDTERELWVVRSVFRDCVSVPIAFGLRTTCITSLFLPPLLRWQISTQSLAPCTNGGLASLAMIVPTFFADAGKMFLHNCTTNNRTFSDSLARCALQLLRHGRKLIETGGCARRKEKDNLNLYLFLLFSHLHHSPSPLHTHSRFLLSDFLPSISSSGRTRGFSFFISRKMK